MTILVGEDFNIWGISLSVAMSDLSSIQNDHTDKVKILNDLLSLSENIYISYIRADSILKRKYLRMFFDGIYVDDKEIVRVEYNSVIAQLTKIREVRITNNWRKFCSLVRNLIIFDGQALFNVWEVAKSIRIQNITEYQHLSFLNRSF